MADVEENINSTDPYYNKPTEVLAKKRAAEVYLNSKGLLAPGAEFEDKHFDYLMNREILPGNVNMIIRAVGKDKTIDEIKADKELYEDAKKRFKNIMNKIAVNDDQQQIPTAKHGMKVKNPYL